MGSRGSGRRPERRCVVRLLPKLIDFQLKEDLDEYPCWDADARVRFRIYDDEFDVLLDISSVDLLTGCDAIDPDQEPAWAVVDWVIDDEADYRDKLICAVEAVIPLCEFGRMDLRKNLSVPSRYSQSFVEDCVTALRLDPPRCANRKAVHA